MNHHTSFYDLIDKFISKMDLPIRIVDADGVVIWMNQMLGELLGMHPDEVKNHQESEILSAFHAEVSAKLRVEALNIMRHLKSIEIETELDGMNISLCETSYPFVIDDSTKIVVTTTSDITRLKSFEQAFKETDNRYRTLFNSASDGIFILSAGKLIECNSATIQIFGGKEESDILGRTPFDFSPEYQPDGENSTRKGEDLIAKALSGTPQLFYWRHKRLNGIEFDAEIALNDLTHSGKVYLQAMIRDISIQMKTDEKLRNSEAQLRALFDHAQYAIGTSVNGSTHMVNTAYAKLFGYGTTDELRGTPILNLIAESEHERIKEFISRRMKGEEVPGVYETIGLKKDGLEFPMEVRVTVYQQEDDLTSVVMMQDISERKQAEKEIEGANLDLKIALDELKELKDKIEAENVILREEVRLSSVYKNIVGKSDRMKSVLVQAEQVAATDSTVLILGETGTGKELLARAIHEMSNRKDKSFIVVNCAALPATLVESELFGREKGAFTGAISRQIGRFEIADGATIFLDEIGELPLDTQSKLLRVLQEGHFERLGSSKLIQVDVRVIAATNRDLVSEIKQGRFREDLYYRLNVFPLELPPLRDRREDILLLTWTFIEAFKDSMGKRINKISAEGAGLLENYSWPGNIRELKNVIERSMIKSTGNILRIELPEDRSTALGPHRGLNDMERAHILSVLEETHWRIRGSNGAAEILEMKPTTLASRMKRLGIVRPT